MDAISANADALVRDARRGSHPGAIGDAPDRAASIIASPIDSILGRTAPSASPLSVAIDGPGMFVFEDRGRRAYGRLGDFRPDARGVLVDGAGRTVLGVPPNAVPERSALSPIQTRGASAISIGEDGFVYGTESGGARKPIARIVLGLFSAPERLARNDETTVRETAAAGEFRLEVPGTANVGSLQGHALENALVDVDGDLAGMWRLSRRGDLTAAQAYAADECERDALGLVK
jgi:flagellar hook protein FlgE